MSKSTPDDSDSRHEHNGLGSSHSAFKPSKYQTAFAGAMAGLISRLVIAPLDIVKIRLQLQIHPFAEPQSASAAKTYNGVFSIIRTIIRDEGLTGFWKGNISAELMYVGYGSIQFGAYATLHKYLLEKGSDTRSSGKECRGNPSTVKVKEKGIIGVESFIAGAVSGGTATIFTYPFDLLRTRFAAQGNDRVYISIVNSIKSIHRDEGLKGFFRGSSAALAQIVPNMGFFFACYETLQPFISSLSFFAQKCDRNPHSQSTSKSTLAQLSPFSTADALAGSLASIFAKTLVFPLDTVRKRLQVQGPTRTRYVQGERMPEYVGVYRTIGRIVKDQGFLRLYRGLGVTLIKAAPASAVTMWVYEGVLREMGKIEERN
ncbi:mitochondrial thiamine pyrophosphate transporter [Ascosphaera aggregata]|nr:mitochondrial thiamine pyrophosphate transporter [Ascosphaera aggregata]